MSNISFNIGKIRVVLIAVLFFCYSYSFAQNDNLNYIPPGGAVPDSIKTSILTQPIAPNAGATQYLSLQQCIEYALQHQPALNVSLINVDVANATNKIALAGWLPQVSSSGSFIHNFQLSNNTTTTNGSNTQSNHGFVNTFVPGISVSQAIFSPSLLYAYKSAPLYIQQARQATDSTKIFLVSSVSKSFYNVLLTLEQINVLREDTARLGKNLRDAYHQYKGGIVDETDYEEAEITLNNSMAQLKQAKENVVPQYAALKRLMGFPPEQQFNVNFDTLEMMRSIHVDTAQQLQYEKRIEFQQIKTEKDLQNEQVNYYKFSFLPTLSAFYNYNEGFENNSLSNLFLSAYPASYIGISFSIPVFTGFARTQSLHRARLQEKIIDWRQIDLKSQIYSEYTSALANYKSNFYNLGLLQRNVALAKRTYFVVTLQYRQGIVPYLNVITAESNLITSEISYLNALFQVLSSKIDLQKAMGNISY